MIRAFRALADQAPTAMAVLDARGSLSYANRAFADLFDVEADPEELVDVEWSSLLSEDAADDLTQRILPLAKVEPWEGELRGWRRSHATSTPLHVRVAPIPSQTDVALSVVVTVPPPQRTTSEERQRTSAAILPIAHRVIVVPVTGTLEAREANLLMRAVLAGISKYRAKAVIIDVTGLFEFDLLAAGYLAKTVLASRLKGARTVVSGVGEEASELLTDIETDWGDIAIAGELRTALVIALAYVGIALHTTPKTAVPSR